MKKNKKYLSFNEMRVAYVPKDDTVQITSGDPDLAKDGWRLVLQRHTPAERTLRTMLEHEGILKQRPMMPDFIAYPAVDPYPWYEFPIGVDAQGETVTLDLLHNGSGVALVGRTGAGKSVIEASMLQHVSNTFRHWQVTGVDLKRVQLEQYEHDLLLRERFTHVTELEKARDSLLKLENLAWQRHSDLENIPGQTAAQLIEAGIWQAQLLLLDEAYYLLAVEYGPELEGEESISEHNALLRDIRMRLVTLTRLGGTVGIFTVVATQLASFVVFPPELIDNLEHRVIAGNTSKVSLSLIHI